MNTSNTRSLLYITTEKAPLYRTIMRVFMDSKERFVFQLGLHDIVAAVQASDVEEIESALAQLCEWGNLQTRSDTTSASTVGDFLKPRQTFAITSRGSAAERAVALDERSQDDDIYTDSTALTDILHAAQELRRCARDASCDPARIHLSFLMLRTRFEDLTVTAEALVDALEQCIDLQSHDAREVADFCERFLSDLVLAAAGVEEVVRELEGAGLDSLLRATAERSARGSLRVTAERISVIRDQWQSFWLRLSAWFISKPGRLSKAEVLRERVRTSLPVLLSIITTIKDRRIHRIDRSNDFRVLARWFAQADSDDAAHRLWRAVFGLIPARHLLINEATLDDFEAQHLPMNTSWVDAPPLRVPESFRNYSNSAQAGGLTYIVDRTAEKEKLAAAAHEEAVRILNAQSRFGTGNRMRLSQLEDLKADEFDVLLDVLGEAVSARVLASEPVEIFSGDGCLKIKLEPTDDGLQASIPTADGVLAGPDHWITIEHVMPDEVSI